MNIAITVDIQASVSKSVGPSLNAATIIIVAIIQLALAPRKMA